MMTKSWGVGLRAALLLTALAVAREAAGKASPEPRAGIGIWDTGKASEQAWTPEALSERKGWTAVAQDRTPASFQGDVVVANGRFVAVFRKQSNAVEVHSGGEGAFSRFRAVLQAADGSAARLSALALVENGKSRACLEATYKTAKGTPVAARFCIKKGDVGLEADPGTGAAGLRVE